MIIRTPNRDRYTIVSKVPLEDERLSWKARGLLAYLLSKPDNWTVMVAHLVKQAPDGRSSVMTALVELERAGYIVRTKRRGDSGRFDGLDCEIHEEPATGSRKSAYGETAHGESDTNEEGLLVKKETNRRQQSRRKADPIFDTLVDLCQIDTERLTASARGGINRAAKELRDAGATEESLRSAANAYKIRYETAAVTPTALAKHYPTLGVRAQRPAPSATPKARCSECDGTGWTEEPADELGPGTVSRCGSCSGRGTV